MLAVASPDDIEFRAPPEPLEWAYYDDGEVVTRYGDRISKRDVRRARKDADLVREASGDDRPIKELLDFGIYDKGAIRDHAPPQSSQSPSQSPPQSSQSPSQSPPQPSPKPVVAELEALGYISGDDLEPEPLLVLAMNDENDEGEEDPPEVAADHEDEHDHEAHAKSDPEAHPDILAEMEKADDAKDKVEVQEQAINRSTEDVEDINTELADILEELRRKKGLPFRDPYTSPLQQEQQQQQEQLALPNGPPLPHALQQPPLLLVEGQHEDWDAAAPPDDGLYDCCEAAAEEAAAEEPAAEEPAVEED